MIQIELQSPSVEILVKAKDASGKKAQITVGFARYTADTGQEKAIETLALMEQYTNQAWESDKEKADTLKEYFATVWEVLRGEVLYICNATIVDSTGRQKKVDTRTTELGWSSPAETCEKLLELYWASRPWRDALIEAMFNAFRNVPAQQSAEVGN
jgi:hypothetical protein